MREHDDRRAARPSFHVALQPFELLRAQPSEPAGLQVEHVHQADEVHALMIEAVPSTARGALAVAREVRGPVVPEDVVLARNVEGMPRRRPRRADHLLRDVEFAGLGELGDVSRVEQEGRLTRQRVDAGHRFLKRRRDVLVRRLAEADVTIADLNEEEVRRGISLGRHAASERGRAEHASFQRPEHPGPSPRHAFEKSATVDPVVAMVVDDVVRHENVPSVTVSLRSRGVCRAVPAMGCVYSRTCAIRPGAGHRPRSGTAPP